MDVILQAIVIGVVQGLTEFLPVSSSAHLILVPRVLGWDDPFILSAAFDATLHLGTLVALIAYFWRDLWRYLLAFLRLLRDRSIAGDNDRKVALLLAISVIPGALMGIGLESFVDTFFREQLLVVCALLVVGAVILFVAERAARHTHEMEELTRVQALGLALLVWAIAVFFFDLILITMVSSTSLSGGGLLLALLLNPVEIVRVLAIIQLEPDLQILGPFGSYLMERTGRAGASLILGAALVVWTAVPVAVAAYLFERDD